MIVYPLLTPRAMRGRRVARWLLAAVYLTAGISHITVPEPFLMKTPDCAPYPHQAILGTGLRTGQHG